MNTMRQIDLSHTTKQKREKKKKLLLPSAWIQLFSCRICLDSQLFVVLSSYARLLIPFCCINDTNYNNNQCNASLCVHIYMCSCRPCSQFRCFVYLTIHNGRIPNNKSNHYYCMMLARYICSLRMSAVRCIQFNLKQQQQQQQNSMRSHSECFTIFFFFLAKCQFESRTVGGISIKSVDMQWHHLSAISSDKLVIDFVSSQKLN